MRELEARLVALRGALVLGVLCAVPLAFWAGSVSLGARFDGRYATLTSLATLAA